LLFKNGRQMANTGRIVLTTDDASKLGIPKDRCEQYERVFAYRCCEKYKTAEYLAQLVACGTRDHWVAFYRYLYHYSEVDPILFMCIGASNAAEYTQKYTSQVHHSDRKMVQEFIDYLALRRRTFCRKQIISTMAKSLQNVCSRSSTFEHNRRTWTAPKG